MLISDQLWANITETKAELKHWTTWLNKYAENGTLIDTDDNTSFINPAKNKAIKLMFEPESDSIIDSWESKFGDEESGIIETLNIVFNDLSLAQKRLENLLDEWL